MECREAIEQTRKQVKNIPSNINRIVIPVGSGMSLAGLLWGLFDLNEEDSIFSYMQNVPQKILGIVVGANPEKRLNKYAPPMWQDQVELIESDIDYHKPAKNNLIGDITIDPIYEAKCLPYLEKNDLFWIVGIRPKY
jgi:1-aminocyclopropane-1-carboxylate deaminase/D-cysteine desulfhydrase-like pyridoxal-dependent ACC family enzyme